MAVSTPEVLSGFFNTARASGTKSVNSDAYFEVVGHEDLALLTKQFPWPVIGVGETIEAPLPMGGMTALPGQLRTLQQGQITFTETVAGRVMAFMMQIARDGGIFDAIAYEGVPQAFHRAYRLKGCIFQPDVADRDWENRTQLTLINGTLNFNFFGETIPGNIT